MSWGAEPWICEACGRRYSTSGFCDDYPSEPRLDLNDQDVVLMLEEQDQRRRERRFAAMFLVAIALGLPFALWSGWTGARDSGSWIRGYWSYIVALGYLGLAPVVLAGWFPARQVLPRGPRPLRLD